MKCCLFPRSQTLLWQSQSRGGAAAAQSYFGLVGAVVAHPLPVLVHFVHQHFPRAEVKGAQVHGAAQVTRQLRLAPELLSTGAGKSTPEKDGGKLKPCGLPQWHLCNSGERIFISFLKNTCWNFKNEAHTQL